ncbi:MAG: SPASM domain-containing protein [Clostridium sp.]|nr:SPASM domain-containing protein [Clostridium sp.]
MTALRKAYLEITNVCNLNCDFCPGTRRAPGFLAPEDFRTLAGRLRHHTEYLYLHLMGEPLLHPELEAILAIAGELGFQVMITTNGTLLPEREELLLGSPAVRKVSISLHSFEGNEGGGSLEVYLDHCLGFARRASQAGKRSALRLWNLEEGREDKSAGINPAVLDRIEICFPKPWKVDWQGTKLAPGIYLEWGERFEWPDLEAREGEQAVFCRGLRDQVGVLWDGTVVPCCLDHEGDVPLGNLYEQELEEILLSPRAQAIYRGFSASKAVEALCRRCGYARQKRRS